MPSKKLMTLLEAFSGSERSRFKKYLHSPYFNENQEVRILYDLLLEKLQKGKGGYHNNSTAEKQSIWYHLFGEQPYNDEQIRRLLSELSQHALHFLALERFQKEPVKIQLLSLDVLKDLELPLHFKGVARQAVTLQEKSGIRDSNFHLHQYLLEEQLYQNIEKSERKAEMFENLAQADYHLDCYYISQKLRNYCIWLDYRNIFSIDAKLHLPPGFLDWINHENYIQEPINQTYILLINMLLQPENESAYYDLKNVLLQKNYLFNDKELKGFYIFLINYCIDKKINVGKTAFFQELFEILKKALKENIILERDMLHAAFYKLIVSVGIQVKEFAWTESFIQTYTPKLPPEEQENALTYNLAKVYFAQQQYEKVIEQLREVEYDNLTYALGGKLMLLKTYYELNEYLALDSLIDSFRVYLRRNQTISKEVRQQYLNVLRFIKKMSNVRPGDRAAIAKIEQQIQECKNLADKGWIVSKVDELKEDRRIGG